MNEPLTALCDQCDYITDIVFKEKKHPNNIQETYFKCEHCHHHYTSFVTDAWVRKKHREMNRMRQGSIVDKWSLADKRLMLQGEINSRMTQLKYNLINFGRADL